MLLPEVAARLSGQSLVTTGFVVRQGAYTDKQDKQIVLYETGGTSAERFLGASPTVEQPGLQIVVRGEANDYETPRLQIERIYQAMIGWGAFTQSSVRYLQFIPLQSPFMMKKDENGRVYFAVNFIVQKEMSATS